MQPLLQMTKKQGGPREGAGRPAGPPDLVKVPVGYRLPRWLVDWMREQPQTQAELIEHALIKTYKLKPPSP
jgi:hypothetical protein